MDLILHLGAHRTASTALERSLSRNAGILRGEGLAIRPPKTMRRIPGFPAVRELHRHSREDAQAKAELAQVARALRQSFDEADQAGAGRLLISEENMIGLMAQNLRRKTFYGDARARLAAYAHVLPQAPVRVGLGIRGYAGFWRSSYLHVLRRRSLLPFPEYAAKLAGARRGWLDLVDAVAAAFPGAEILVWTQEGLEGRVTQTACRLIGRKGAKGLKPFRRRPNRGLAPSDMPLIFRLREADPALVEKALDARLADLRAADPPTEAPTFFTEAQERAMARRYAADLEALQQGHAGARLLSNTDPAEVTR
ncbi:MAG: hypothetical protein WCD16_07790 [Paracoccaceae bacterium]